MKTGHSLCFIHYDLPEILPLLHYSNLQTKEIVRSFSTSNRTEVCAWLEGLCSVLVGGSECRDSDVQSIEFTSFIRFIWPIYLSLLTPFTCLLPLTSDTLVQSYSRFGFGSLCIVYSIYENGRKSIICCVEYDIICSDLFKNIFY